jgi:hypothetical protein
MSNWPEFAAMLAAAQFESPMAQSVTIDGQTVRAIVRQGMELVGDYGQIIGQQTQIEIPAGMGVTSGDTVSIDGTDYAFDVIISNDGHVARWVLRAA